MKKYQDLSSRIRLIIFLSLLAVAALVVFTDTEEGFWHGFLDGLFGGLVAGIIIAEATFYFQRKKHKSI